MKNRKSFIIGLKSTSLELNEIRFLKKYKPWGIILFKRNIKSIKQSKILTDNIKKLFNDYKYPILIDQEGGKVNRLSNIIDVSFFTSEFFGKLYKKNSSKFEVYYKIFIKQTSYLLKSIGANKIINTSVLMKESKPLDKGFWDGAVDTVGGQVLANILAQTKESGIVAACGNAADIKLNTTVMPFIIRGVKLWGINSVNLSIKRREFLWNEAAKLINFDLLSKSIKEISLEGLLDIFPKMLKGETSGRYIIDLKK